MYAKLKSFLNIPVQWMSGWLGSQFFKLSYTLFPAKPKIYFFFLALKINT